MNSTQNIINSDLFNLVSSITVSAVALIGNSIVFYILTKKEFLKESVFRCLFIGTIFNTINALHIWPSNYPDFFLKNKSLFSCILINYVSAVFDTFSAWMIVLTSTDIYLTVKYPTKFLFRKKINYQMIIISILFILFCSLYSPYFIYTTIDPNYGCIAVSFEIAFYINLYFLILFTVLPFIIMAITNSLTYLHLQKRQINQNNSKKAKRLFKTSLGLNLFFLISNIPVSTVFIIGNISNINFSNVIYNIFKLITYAYFSLDFFIYYIANRLFRVYFFYLIKCGKSK